MNARNAAFALAAAFGFLSVSANAATHNVETVPFVGFVPQILEINPGDTVVWRNRARGDHNVIADDRSFGNSVSNTEWTFTRTFDKPGVVPYYCVTHGGPGGEGMSGEIRVKSSFTINEGIQGSWLNPSTGGQGVFFDVMPGSSNLFAMAWFTWTQNPGERDWLTAVGTFSGGTAQMDVFRSRGGRFNAGDPVTTTPVGNATVTFTSCSAAELRFTLLDPSVTATVPLRRLLPTSPICVSANPSTVSPE